MPIKIPDQLPARDILTSERIDVMDESTAIKQDIRPMKVILFNLMPDKITTETQIARILGSSPLQIELTLLRTDSYTGTNTPESHLTSFYKVFDDIKDDYFDGLIITGAPVEHIHYEDVVYWQELKSVMQWADNHCFSQFYICWAAQAALYHQHGIEKENKDQKYFGIYNYKRHDFSHPLTRGFDDTIGMPVSRYTKINPSDILNNNDLHLLFDCPNSGAALVTNQNRRKTYMFNHLEYDRTTLADEYKRDKERGLSTDVPDNYYPGNDTNEMPTMNWRAHSRLLFLNWISDIYQNTPYNLSKLKEV